MVSRFGKGTQLIYFLILLVWQMLVLNFGFPPLGEAHFPYIGIAIILGRV